MNIRILFLTALGYITIISTDADINAWLPGDYELQVGIVDIQSHEPKIKMAIEGRDAGGWYTIGKITVNN